MENQKSNMISEKHTKNPLSPYGYSKLVVENILESMSLANGMNIGILRYFNVSGADPKKELVKQLKTLHI